MTTNSILLKVLGMVTKRLYLVILLLAIGCQQSGVSAEKPSAPVSEAAAKTELSKELKIYKNTLFEGKNEQIRIDAASVMLSSDEPAAREILLNALRQTENSTAGGHNPKQRFYPAVTRCPGQRRRRGQGQTGR